MKRVLWLFVCLAAVGLNAWPSYWYSSARADKWQCGVPIEWLIVSYGGVPQERYFFTIDFLALIVGIAFWALVGVIATWLFASVKRRLTRKV